MYFLSIDLAINGLIIAGLAKTQVNITFVKWQHDSKGIPRICLMYYYYYKVITCQCADMPKNNNTDSRESLKIKWKSVFHWPQLVATLFTISSKSGIFWLCVAFIK